MKFKIEYEIGGNLEVIEGESREEFKEAISLLKTIDAKNIIVKNDNGETLATF